jgi:hypothetical protein
MVVLSSRRCSHQEDEAATRSSTSTDRRIVEISLRSGSMTAARSRAVTHPAALGWGEVALRTGETGEHAAW